MDETGKSKRQGGYRSGGGAGAFYTLGFIGAVVYYIREADGFWEGVVGVLQAFVWPAFLVYELLKSTGAS